MKNAKRRSMPAEQIIDFLRVPGRVTELESIAIAAGQGCEKDSQTLAVKGPIRRELKYNRTELRPQQLGAGNKFCQRRRRVLQLLHVCDEAAALHRKSEIRRHGRPPGLQRGLR